MESHEIWHVSLMPHHHPLFTLISRIDRVVKLHNHHLTFQTLINFLKSILHNILPLTFYQLVSNTFIWIRRYDLYIYIYLKNRAYVLTIFFFCKLRVKGYFPEMRTVQGNVVNMLSISYCCLFFLTCFHLCIHVLTFVHVPSSSHALMWAENGA